MGAMKTHDKILREWRQDLEFVREYDSLAPEFALFDELLRARQEAGLTQAEVAKLMATQPSVVARLEAGGGRLKHSPSLATLQNYAEAVGCRLDIKMVRVPPQRATGTGPQPRA
jgi:DNA-binding XRE family transcriptional regulator